MRFPEFEGEWERLKLGKIARFSKGKGISKAEIEENGKTECIRYGELYTTYNEIIDTVISKTNTKPNKLILSEENDIIIPASGETQIDIATASCVMKSGVALGGDLNIIKTPLNGIFLSYYLNSKKKVEIANLAQGISVVHLYSSQLSMLEINYPSSQEQSKIADFLSLCETRIQQSSKIIEGLKSFKSAMSKRIFSQELRFKDDNGEEFPEWDEKKLGEMCEFFRGSPISKIDLTEDGNYYCIHYGELFTKYSEVIETIVSKTNKENGFLSRIGDILMPSSDVTPNGLAKASAIQLENIILGGDMNILRPEKQYNSVYLSYLLNFNTKKIIEIVSGTTVKHIYNKDLRNLEFVISNSLSEQIKIANFLSAIDEKIETEKKIQEQYKIQKTYLLQNMFV